MAMMPAALPSGRNGRALALALTVLLLALVWIGAVAPLLDWYGGRAEQVARDAALVARMRDVVATLPELRRQAAAPVSADAQTSGATLAGDTDALAAATLQGMVESMAARLAIRLTSVEPLPGDKAAGGLRRIGLRITLSASWPALVGLLQAIVQAGPPMLVDDLQLRVAPTFAQIRAVPLYASFSVLAFRQDRALPAEGTPSR